MKALALSILLCISLPCVVAGLLLLSDPEGDKIALGIKLLSAGALCGIAVAAIERLL